MSGTRGETDLQYWKIKVGCRAEVSENQELEAASQSANILPKFGPWLQGRPTNWNLQAY